jgi:hypothetical protein
MTIPTASVKNPLDATFDMNLFNYYVNLPIVIMESGEVDSLIIYGVFGFQEVVSKYINDDRIRNHIEIDEKMSVTGVSLEKMLIDPTLKVSKKYSIPIIYINTQNYSSSWSKKIRESGATLFQFWDRPIRTLAKLCQYAEYRHKHE